MSTVYPPPEAAEFCKILGLRIRQLREGMRISQAELSRRAGTSRATITQIEGGKQAASMATLARIGSALELPCTVFFEAPHTPPRLVTLDGVRRVVREELARLADAPAKGGGRGR